MALPRRCVSRQLRRRGSQHKFLNWHNLDTHHESYHSLTEATMYDRENINYNIRKSDWKWDSVLTPGLYRHTHRMHEPSMKVGIPNWTNEHLFARAYWNTNLNLYYWENFHLNFYYIERRRRALKSVYTNNFVFTPRWAYNLVLLYTKNNTWDYLDCGLRMKTMLYVNSHVWLVFKFKMQKAAKLKGMERGLSSREEAREPVAEMNSFLRKEDNLDHNVPDEAARDHRQEGAGMAFNRQYASVATMAGPEFAREHTKNRPWWWHAYPAKRRRWDASNPFGHDQMQGSYGGSSTYNIYEDVGLDRKAMSSW
eukprot:TRINITY_DN6019_c0_g1_i1.p1 TRINITY_DN6019_c0_g1~~TRINITY_DN6019_c0_g1_i1.p1  ORF type:complete len:310 (+),score=46.61 TRINITY_DN6019_c0_g1_i1:388-1317(+)